MFNNLFFFFFVSILIFVNHSIVFDVKPVSFVDSLMQIKPADESFFILFFQIFCVWKIRKHTKKTHKVVDRKETVKKNTGQTHITVLSFFFALI